MAADQSQADISDNPAMRTIAEAVRQTGTPCVLTEGGEAVAVVVPLAPDNPSPKRRHRKSGVLRPDDPIFRLIGIGESGKTDVSANKHEYLAEAYRAKSR